MKQKSLKEHIVTVRLTENILAHVWIGGRIIIEGYTADIQSIIQLLKVALDQQKKPIPTGFSPITEHALKDHASTFDKALVEKKVQELLESLKTQSPLDQAGKATEIIHTEFGTTGSITDIPGWQTKTPEQLAISAMAMGMAQVTTEGEWTHEDIKKIPGWQSMTPQQITDKLKAAKWWERPPEAGEPLHRVYCPRCSLVSPMFHEGLNYTGSRCPRCPNGYLQKVETVPSLVAVAAATESQEKFDSKAFQCDLGGVCKHCGTALSAGANTCRECFESGKQLKPELKELKLELQKVMQERGKIYGEPHLSHENIGLEWTGILQQHYGIRLDHPIPYWLVELMLASFKVHRSARVYHPDNFLDVRAYLEFAEHGQAHPNEPFVKHKPLPEEKP